MLSHADQEGQPERAQTICEVINSLGFSSPNPLLFMFSPSARNE